MKKWYLQLCIICLLFCFSFLIVPAIVGIVMLVWYYRKYYILFSKCESVQEAETKITEKADELDTLIKDKYIEINTLESRYKTKQDELKTAYQSLSSEYSHKTNSLDNKFDKKKKEWEDSIEELKKEYKSLTESTLTEHYNFSDYDGLTSEECRNKISLIQVKEQSLLKNEKAVNVGYIESKKMQNNNVKQIIRCFNAECNNILMNVSSKNIDTMRSKIQRAYESLNKIFEVDKISLAPIMLNSKLEQLNLTYTYEIKKEQEKELQKEIKAQMLEEEKVRREIEREKKKIEKDQTQFTNEVNRLMKYLQKTDNDVEKQLYIGKIKDLEEKLSELEERKANVLEREANAKAGFVYIISNIGSFGEDIYKIGMTRRLEPMDRIKELSSASVPFEFDVHAMIFSENAPELENALHKHFEENSVNKINPRKEFFKVSIDEIERVTKEKYNNIVEFTKVPVAKEYRQTLEINSHAS